MKRHTYAAVDYEGDRPNIPAMAMMELRRRCKKMDEIMDQVPEMTGRVSYDEIEFFEYKFGFFPYTEASHKTINQET
jgi:hypothetical protein